MNTNELADAITTALVSGDTYEVDGEVWSVEATYDEITTINDYECYGEVSKYAYDYWSESQTPRPSHFTGRAVKIQVDRGYWMWWEPPVGGDYISAADWDSNAELRRSFTAQVRDLLEGGFMLIHVKRRGDSRRRDINEYLGGCDTWELKDYADHISDMIHAAISNEGTN